MPWTRIESYCILVKIGTLPLIQQCMLMPSINHIEGTLLPPTHTEPSAPSAARIMSWNSASSPTIGLLCTTLNVRSVATHWYVMSDHQKRAHILVKGAFEPRYTFATLISPTNPSYLSTNRTEADKEEFLTQVKKNGLDDLEALADGIGTKSEQELDFFLSLLHEHLGRQYLQALANAQPANEPRVKRNKLMAKVFETVMNGTFEGHMHRLLTNVTLTDPDVLFTQNAAGKGGTEAGKMGGVGRRQVAAPVPKKGYTKRKREEETKKHPAKKSKAKAAPPKNEQEEEEKVEEDSVKEEQPSAPTPKEPMLGNVLIKVRQEEGQKKDGVEEEEEDVVDAGVYEENVDDWEPAAGVAEQTDQKFEVKGQGVA